jgi:type V secretory pathway adhesin AidA
MAKRSAGGSKTNGIVIKAKATSSRILEIGQNGVKTEFSDKGTMSGKYRGVHWDTVETQMNIDGTSSWHVRFIQMTDKGDMLVGEGEGTGEAPNSRGIAKLKGGGTIMTASERLAELNGKRWTCEVDNNVATGSAQVRVTFQ